MVFPYARGSTVTVTVPIAAVAVPVVAAVNLRSAPLDLNAII